MVDTNGSSEEDDYMSEKFLNVHVQVEKLKPAKVIREIELDKKRRIANANNCRKSKQHLEDVNRQKALDTKIDSSNLGYQMLLKMGYKEGRGLDKGVTDPIKLTIKKGRGGLGMNTESDPSRDSNPNSILNSAQKRFKSSEQRITTDVFIKKLKTNKLSQQLCRDISTAKTTCRHLDEYKNVENPDLKYWPIEEDHPNSDPKEVSTLSPPPPPEDEVFLDEILDYLRNTHFYCIYCGTSYNDGNDLNENCPGKNREDH